MCKNIHFKINIVELPHLIQLQMYMLVRKINILYVRIELFFFPLNHAKYVPEQVEIKSSILSIISGT